MIPSEDSVFRGNSFIKVVDKPVVLCYNLITFS
nr:MAG TPA: hypothetical protein [Caudoviricetes sp.]